MYSDYIIFVFGLLYFITIFFSIDNSIGEWTNNLTHLVALPAILIDFPSILSISTTLTVVASALFHIVDTYNLDKDKNFRRLDHGFSIFMIYIVIVTIFYDEQVPYYMFLLVFLVSMLPSAFLIQPRIYIPLTYVAIGFMIPVYILKLKNKHVKYLTLSFILFICGIIIRVIDTEREYKLHVHSIWHVFVFSALYYSVLFVKHNRTCRTTRYNYIVKLVPPVGN